MRLSHSGVERDGKGWFSDVVRSGRSFKVSAISDPTGF